MLRDAVEKRDEHGLDQRLDVLRRSHEIVDRQPWSGRAASTKLTSEAAAAWGGFPKAGGKAPEPTASASSSSTTARAVAAAVFSTAGRPVGLVRAAPEHEPVERRVGDAVRHERATAGNEPRTRVFAPASERRMRSASASKPRAATAASRSLFSGKCLDGALWLTPARRADLALGEGPVLRLIKQRQRRLDEGGGEIAVMIGARNGVTGGLGLGHKRRLSHRVDIDNFIWRI